MNENRDQRSRPRRHAGESHSRGSIKRLGFASAANVAFAVVQVLVGVAIGSIVVLADAAHQAVDALGLVTALLAMRMARRPANERFSYGLGKSDALGGFVSALLLVGSVAWIVWESVHRLLDPVVVDGTGVIFIGLVAIVVNGTSVVLIGHGDHADHADHADHGDGDISLRAARLHLLTDLAGSVVVVASGVLLTLGAPAWIDPAASLLLSTAVLWSTWRLVVTATHLLLDRVPGRLSTDAVIAALVAEPGVEGAHHVHLRPIGGGRVSVTAHIVVDGALSVHDAQATVERLGAMLNVDHLIGHSTLQLECHDCDDEIHADVPVSAPTH